MSRPDNVRARLLALIRDDRQAALLSDIVAAVRKAPSVPAGNRTEGGVLYLQTAVGELSSALLQHAPPAALRALAVYVTAVGLALAEHLDARQVAGGGA